MLKVPAYVVQVGIHMFEGVHSEFYIIMFALSRHH